MGKIVQDIRANIAESLSSRTIGRCSRWVEKVRFIGEPPAPYSFYRYPWLKDLHNDNSQEIVIMKGAQLGFTEYALNRTLFALDQIKVNVLYALPNERPDAMGFSKGRINPASDLSPYIEGLFAISKGEGHKITKDSKSLYIRGARSRICFKQIDVGLVVLDELDEMTDEAVNLARYRLAGQDRFKQLVMLSTPHIEETGIHKQFLETTQKHFYFPCPACGRQIELTYPKCIKITAESPSDPGVANSYYCCPECEAKIDDRFKAEYLNNGDWVAAYPGRNVQGYTVNQMYSPTVSPMELALQELRARFDIVAKTEFYNSSLGLCFIADDAKITDAMLNDSMKGYLNGDKVNTSNMLVTMGIDIGQEKHFVAIVGWTFDPKRKSPDITVSSVGKLLYYGMINDMGEAEDLMKLWQPRMTIIDAQPDLKNSVELCKKYKGIAYVCYYSLTKAGKQIQAGNVNENSISVNRTFWLDAMYNKFKTYTMSLPQNLGLDIREHLKSLVKTYKRSDDGGTYSEYVKKESAPDHFAHAMAYATIALGMLSGHGGNEYI